MYWSVWESDYSFHVCDDVSVFAECSVYADVSLVFEFSFFAGRVLAGRGGGQRQGKTEKLCDSHASGVLMLCCCCVFVFCVWGLGFRV